MPLTCMVIDRLARGNCSSTLRTAQAETQMSSAATSALNILKQIKPSRQTQHLLRPLASFPVTPRLPIWTSPSNSRTMATSSSAQTSSSDAVRSKSRVEKRPGPVESSMYLKLSQALEPTLLEIRNDSSKHAHHSAMRAQGGGNGETHFHVTVISPSFQSLPQLKRHRLVNGLLKEEFDQMGLHALSLRLKTVEEGVKEGLIAADAATEKGETVEKAGAGGCGCGKKEGER